MLDLSLADLLQVVIALGLLNVWLVRRNSSTPYRGGSSQSLREEFRAYDLPSWSFPLIGVLKVGSAVALLVGLWVPRLVLPASGLIIALMLGALAMHVKVKDSAKKSLPAFLMLAMCGLLFGTSIA